MTGRDLATADLLAACGLTPADLLAASAVVDVRATQGQPHLARIADGLAQTARHLTTTDKETTDDHE